MPPPLTSASGRPQRPRVHGPQHRRTPPGQVGGRAGLDEPHRRAAVGQAGDLGVVEHQPDQLDAAGAADRPPRRRPPASGRVHRRAAHARGAAARPAARRRRRGRPAPARRRVGAGGARRGRAGPGGRPSARSARRSSASAASSPSAPAVDRGVAHQQVVVALPGQPDRLAQRERHARPRSLVRQRLGRPGDARAPTCWPPGPGTPVGPPGQVGGVGVERVEVDDGERRVEVRPWPASRRSLRAFIRLAHGRASGTGSRGRGWKAGASATMTRVSTSGTTKPARRTPARAEERRRRRRRRRSRRS